MTKETRNKKVIFTGDIPVCPYCCVPTIRTEMAGTIIAMYFAPMYNEDGENINPDRNIRTCNYTCSKCGCTHSIVGNYIDGWTYDK